MMVVVVTFGWVLEIVLNLVDVEVNTLVTVERRYAVDDQIHFFNW
jgi:hypothetical protein